MHVISTSVAVVGLGAVLVVAPTAMPVATAHPVSPVVHELTVPAVAGAASSPSGRSALAAPRTPSVVAARQAQGVRFDLAGVTFSAPPPAGTVVRVRTHDASGWSAWTELGVDDDGPDPGSPDALHARPGTEPLAALGSDGVDVRVVTPDGVVPPGLRVSLVDGGRSDADAAPTTRPGSAQAAVTRPTIISRASWGADESLSTCTPSRLSGFKAVVVHHTVNSNTYSSADVPALIRSMYAYHVKSQGWCDLGYQLLVDRFGRAYEGRRGSTTGFVEGAQVGGFNKETTGISVIGDFTSTTMPAATVSTVTRLAAWEADRSLFDPSASVTLTSAGGSRYAAGTKVVKPRVMGHRDLSLTGCPGDTAYAKQVPTIRSGAASTWLAGQWTPMAASTALETYARPASSVFSLAGRGFGHGIGMSQWGAYGAAVKGLTWQQILAFYYPGTTRTVQGNPTLRVWLSALGTSSVRFPALTGLVVSDGSRSVTLSSGFRWRIVPDGSGATLQSSPTGTTWTSISGWRALTTPLTMSRPSAGTVRVVLPSGAQREYSGSVRVTPRSGRVYAVNLVDFERYTRGVVPIEMSASWSPAALAAQAVAARTYAANSRATADPTRLSDICDVSCQVYKGVADYSSTGTLVRRWEDSRTTAATTATSGVVLSYGGKPAFTQFSASNGGRTVAGGQPYLPAVEDPYDGVVTATYNPHTWSTSVAAASIESAFPSIGTLRTVAIGSRTGASTAPDTWGGRVASVTLNGSAGSTTVSGDTFRARLGLRSTWWTITSAPARSASYTPRDVTGERLPDVILPSGSALRTLSYTGAMTFTTKQILASGFSGMRAAAAVGPWTPDSLGDVVAIDASGTAWAYPGLGRSGLAAGRYRLATGWSSVDLVVPVGDWDGDGHTDLVTRLTDGRLLLRRGDGAGHVVGTVTIATGWGGLRQVTSVELTGDRHRDLVAVRPSDGTLLMWVNTGTGGLLPARVIGLYGWNAMSAVRGVGDVTGDGRDDLLARRASDGALLVYGGRGYGQLQSPLRAGATSATSWGG